MWPLLFLETLLLFEGGWSGVTLWAALNALLFFAIFYGGLVLHEVGHLLVARAVGLDVPRVQVGVGEPLMRGQWGSRRYTLSSIPLFSFSYFNAPPQTRHLRWRMWLAAAGGPLMTITLLIGAITLGDLSPRGVLWPNAAVSHSLAPFEILAFTSCLILTPNLVPVGADGVHTDGSWLLRLPRMPSAALQEANHAFQIASALDLYLDRDLSGAEEQLQAILLRAPASIAAHNLQCVFLMEKQRVQEARAALQALLAAPPARPSDTAVLQNNLAWANFLLADPQLLPEADELSAAAYARMKFSASCSGTRGAILSWKGQHDEAIPLLERAFSRNTLPRYRALNACSLAISYSALDQHQHGLHWIDRARRLDSNCPLLPRATAILNGQAPSNAA